MTKNRENDTVHSLDIFNNFEKFFDLSHDLFCIAGYDGYFRRINPAVSTLLEYTEEELFSRPINDFIYTDDKDMTSLARNDLRNRKPLFDFENRYLTKSGKIIWLLWTSIPVEDEQLIFAVAKNITLKKELEQEQKKHLKKLTEINNEFKQLSYSTAHDLRSPVNNMLSIFELLETENIQNKETIELITILKSTTNTLQENLNEYIRVLNYKNQADNQLEEINLENSLNEVLISINSLILNSKTTINIDFSETNTVFFNKTYLKSIFLNLITNSIKYAKSNILSSITICTKKQDNSTLLIISDNGIGFDLEKVNNKIFGLHQTFNNHIDSNGIGLYLVHNHITNLGGNITLESKINEGASFTIHFPENNSKKTVIPK